MKKRIVIEFESDRNLDDADRDHIKKEIESMLNWYYELGDSYKKIDCKVKFEINEKKSD